MPIEFHMEPTRRSLSWDEFRTQMPLRSIAIDGFVDHPPEYDFGSLHFNFDHHRGIPRTAMLCTAEQVREAIHDGILDLLMPTGQEVVHVWMLDNDPDVALSKYALEFPWNVRSRVSPAVNRLFGHVGLMDKRNGLVDIPSGLPIVGQVAWMFEPYWEYRLSGAIDRKIPAEHMRVVDDVCARINDYVAGRGQTRAIDDQYETLYRGNGYEVVRELGAHARMKMARRGLRAFVSARQTPEGRWVYTLCRYAPFTFWFPVPEIATHLNQEEDSDCQFGGGDIVYGNARGRGSHRDPVQLARAIDAYLMDRHLTPP